MKKQVNFEVSKELGECYLFMGDYQKAKEQYLQAVACDKSNPAAYLGLAAIALVENDLEGAYAFYCTANGLCYDDKSLAGMAMVELEMGQHEKAFERFIAALRLNQTNMVAINGVVQLGYFMNRLPTILPLLQSALDAGSPESEAIRYTLAGCLTALGRDDEAKSQLEALLGANPENAKAQQLYALFAA